MKKRGYSFYGQKIGILVFNGQSPRIPGDPGNALTFDFQVCYEIVNGSFTDLIDGSDYIKKQLLDAAKRLENKGINAIAGDCGLMGLYQKEICNYVNIPVIASSLTLIPLIEKITNSDAKIGLITGHSQLLNKKHLLNAGIENLDNLIIQGMEDESHFKEIVIDGKTNLNHWKMEKDVVNAVEKLFKKENKISAILLECSNLASYSYTINKTYNIPVFDINTCINLLHNSISPKKFY